jgi:hypothetical protein
MFTDGPSLTLVLRTPDGEETRHESLDAAETEAGRHHRAAHPLRAPKMKWKRIDYKRWFWHEDGEYQEDAAMEIAEACDVPFLGTGHFVRNTFPGVGRRHGAEGSRRGRATIARELEWKGAIGPWLAATVDGQLGDELGYACGYIDPYGAAHAGAYWNATRGQAQDQVRLLIKAANAGRKLYRVYPVRPDDALYLPGSRRQETAWDAWQSDSMSTAHFHSWSAGPYPRKHHTDHRYHYTGKAVYLTQQVLANLKSGKVRHGPMERFDKEQAGMHWPGARAREVARSAALYDKWRGIEYPAMLTERTRIAGKMARVGHTYVEIVEYNDGDEPYTKSLGIFRPRTSHELEIKWGRHPDEKLDVKVFPGTWLTRVEFEHEAVPEHELGQMELGYYWP